MRLKIKTNIKNYVFAKSTVMRSCLVDIYQSGLSGVNAEDRKKNKN